MPHGRHVTEEECREMRRLRRETSYTRRTIGHLVGDSDPYHHTTVEWHVNGRCAHPSEDDNQ